MKRYGLLKSSLDAHTLGINAIKSQLEACGQEVWVGDERISLALREIEHSVQKDRIIAWIKEHDITHLGVSYRLDPKDAKSIMGHLVHALKTEHCFSYDGGSVQTIFFAGLPESCRLIEEEHKSLVKCFIGSESPRDSLIKMGVDEDEIPKQLIESSRYDEDLKRYANELIESGDHLSFKPIPKAGYEGYGTRNDRIVDRIKHHQKSQNLPLTRVHVGPYLHNRKEAVDLFKDWCKQLAKAGYLDIVSIGSSQLTQSNFNEDWTGLSNGGGVPIQNELEYQELYEASRPLLLRTYAGTKNVPELAKIHERSINIAWHALSFWWFNQLDGRGPNDLLSNLQEHIETLKYIAQTKKPFEPNIPHHFAFRGSDDVTYIVSAVLAARSAKKQGIQDFILQVMLNTPRYTTGIVDLAKARAIIQLIKPLLGEDFKMYLQPRAGLDYFAPDIDLAKRQLAVVSMLMDDIEPNDRFSPPLVHVVSYSEALYLATPEVIHESIQITHAAIEKYRQMKASHQIDSLRYETEIQAKTNHFVKEAQIILDSIDQTIHEPYTAQGLYDIFAFGYLPTPYLWGNQEQFPHATHFKSTYHEGSTILIDDEGKKIDALLRIRYAQFNALKAYQALK